MKYTDAVQASGRPAVRQDATSAGKSSAQIGVGRKASAREVGRKLFTSFMAVVLAVGLCPLPAFGDDGQLSGVTFNGTTIQGDYGQNQDVDTVDDTASDEQNTTSEQESWENLLQGIRFDDATKGVDTIDGLNGYTAGDGTLPLSAAIADTDQSEEADAADASASADDASNVDAADEDAQETNPFDAEDAAISITPEVQAMDFSTQRIMVALSSGAIDDRDQNNLVSEGNGIYLLQYKNQDAARRAYMRYSTKPNVVFVAPDAVIAVAAESGGGSSATEDSDAPESSDEDATHPATAPVADLASIEGDAAKLASESSGADSALIALIDTGTGWSSNVLSRTSTIGDELGDENGHGSAMLQTITAEDPDASVISIKALDAAGCGTSASIYAAIMQAIQAGASIINLSFSGYATAANAPIAQAVEQAVAAGITVIGAAGNDGNDAQYYTPGNIQSAFIVGAADENGERLASSNFGSTVDAYVVAESTSYAAARTSGWLSSQVAQGAADDWQASLQASELVKGTAAAGQGEDPNASDDDDTVRAADAGDTYTIHYINGVDWTGRIARPNELGTQEITVDNGDTLYTLDDLNAYDSYAPNGGYDSYSFYGWIPASSYDLYSQYGSYQDIYEVSPSFTDGEELTSSNEGSLSDCAVDGEVYLIAAWIQNTPVQLVGDVIDDVIHNDAATQHWAHRIYIPSLYSDDTTRKQGEWGDQYYIDLPETNTYMNTWNTYMFRENNRAEGYDFQNEESWEDRIRYVARGTNMVYYEVLARTVTLRYVAQIDPYHSFTDIEALQYLNCDTEVRSTLSFPTLTEDPAGFGDSENPFEFVGYMTAAQAQPDESGVPIDVENKCVDRDHLSTLGYDDSVEGSMIVAVYGRNLTINYDVNDGDNHFNVNDPASTSAMQYYISKDLETALADTKIQIAECSYSKEYSVFKGWSIDGTLFSPGEYALTGPGSVGWSDVLTSSGAAKTAEAVWEGISVITLDGTSKTTMGSEKLYAKTNAGVYHDAAATRVFITAKNAAGTPITVPQRSYALTYEGLDGATVGNAGDEASVYSFDGYYLVAIGDNDEPGENKQYITSAGLPNLENFKADTISADTTLYAKWSPTAITLPSNISKPGYVFMGWDVRPTDDPSAEADELRVIDADYDGTYYASEPMTFTAVWYETVAKPTQIIGTDFVYDTTEHTVAEAPSAGYTFNAGGTTADTNKGTNAGDYTAVATLDEGYIWELDEDRIIPTDADLDPYSAAWRISKESLEPAVVTIKTNTTNEGTFSYNGSMQVPEVTVTLNGKVIDPNEYNVTYTLNGSTVASPTVVGEYTVHVSAKSTGNYKDSVRVANLAKYNIAQVSFNDDVEVQEVVATYTGSPLSPDV